MLRYQQYAFNANIINQKVGNNWIRYHKRIQGRLISGSMHFVPPNVVLLIEKLAARDSRFGSRAIDFAHHLEQFPRVVRSVYAERLNGASYDML